MCCLAFDRPSQLGDCWLMAAFASMAEYPDAIRNVRRCGLPTIEDHATPSISASHSFTAKRGQPYLIHSASCKMRLAPAVNIAYACGTLVFRSTFRLGYENIAWLALQPSSRPFDQPQTSLLANTARWRHVSVDDYIPVHAGTSDPYFSNPQVKFARIVPDASFSG